MSLCLVIDEMHPSLADDFAAIGVAIDYQPQLKATDVPAALAARPYDGLVVRSKVRVDAGLLNYGPRLRYVARAGAGVDNIDEAALAAAGVTLLNAPEGNRDAVGEFAAGAAAGVVSPHRAGRCRGAARRVVARGQPGRGNRGQNHRAARLRAHGPGLCAAAGGLRLPRAGPRPRPRLPARRPRHAGAAGRVAGPRRRAQPARSVLRGQPPFCE